MRETTNLLSINDMIYEIRGHKVILDHDLATLYGVETQIIDQAVKRNPDRFPPDFMFQLTKQETSKLRTQITSSKVNWRGRLYQPYVFTEHGVLMLASVLKSRRAVEVFRALETLSW